MRRVVGARSIRDMPQGTRVWVAGREFVRGMDYPDFHLEDLLVDPQTGWIGQWYRLLPPDAEVEYELRQSDEQVYRALAKQAIG